VTVSVLQSSNKLLINFGGHESYPWYNFHPLFPLITRQIMGNIVRCTKSRECHVLEAWNIYQHCCENQKCCSVRRYRWVLWRSRRWVQENLPQRWSLCTNLYHVMLQNTDICLCNMNLQTLLHFLITECACI
jgi:hypothetical protein